MTVRIDDQTDRIQVVHEAADAPAARADTMVIVLDDAWTPLAEDRADLLSARALFADVVARVDLFDGALERLDQWADAGGLADRVIVEETTYWFRLRETMWRWLHERLLWRVVLASIGADRRRLRYSLPAGEDALRDVAARLGTIESQGSTEAPVEVPAPTAVSDEGGPARASMAARILRRLRGAVSRAPSWRAATASSPPETRTAELRARDDRLADRVAALAAGDDPRVVVLTTPATHQRVAAADGARRDPNLGSVIPRLEGAGFDTILVGMGLDHRRDGDWALVADDPRLLPQSLLRTRWSRPEDKDRAARAVLTIRAALEPVRQTRFDLDGVDLAGPFVDALEAQLARIVELETGQRACIERFIAEIAPRAILLTQEGIRVPWLAAGADAGVPVFAVQHGVLYEGHPGYPHRRHPAVRRPAVTFVYGEDEREMLLRRGAYLDSEVVVSGSPRLDLDARSVDVGGDRDGDRDAVRRELGVRGGDRLLVVSTVNLPFLQRAHLAPMLDRLLGGPMPGVHVVFKQHPGERDDGPYEALLTGLARARGHAVPPISVVRDIDLYRLLRAADAHLGLHSTVLTDAVAAGTPNLIAMTDAHADLLGYVEAGVARPVRTVDDIRAALAEPSDPDPAAREAFIERHFRAGDAGERIAAVIANAAGTTSC
jgi:hypothetical protein